MNWKHIHSDQPDKNREILCVEIVFDKPKFTALGELIPQFMSATRVWNIDRYETWPQYVEYLEKNDSLIPNFFWIYCDDLGFDREVLIDIENKNKHRSYWKIVD